MIDLSGGLRDGASAAGVDARDLYWPRDQHWNPRGHAEAARLIAESLSGGPARPDGVPHPDPENPR